MGIKIHKPGIKLTFSWIVALVLLCIIQLPNYEVLAEESDTNAVEAEKRPQVRYRMRPVAAFRSTNSNPSDHNSTSSNSSSSEAEGPGPSGVPFIAVHELTSQTLEKLHENWKNLETFVRNFQNRQDESLRSPPTSQSGRSPTGETGRRPPYGSPSSNNNNVYTFRYHPIVLDESSTRPRHDILGAGTPTRTLNGINFNSNAIGPNNVDHDDIERHTIATVYTVGICLTIMAIGSVMFILINKCDGSGGNSNYIRTSATAGSNGNRIARSMFGAAANARGGRQANGRGRSSRGGSGGNNGNSMNATASGEVCEINAKVLTDLPPSYDSLFPESGPKPSADEQTTVITTEINVPLSASSASGAASNTQTHNSNANLPLPTAV